MMVICIYIYIIICVYIYTYVYICCYIVCSFDYIDTCAHHDGFGLPWSELSSGQWAFEAAGDCATAAGSGPAEVVRTSTERIHWLFEASNMECYPRVN